MSAGGGCRQLGGPVRLPTAQTAAPRIRMHTAPRPGNTYCRQGRCRVLDGQVVALCERHAVALLLPGGAR